MNIKAAWTLGEICWPNPDPVPARTEPDREIPDLLRANVAIVAVVKGAPGNWPIGQLPLRAHFHWVTARRSAIIQASPGHSGHCADGASALQPTTRRMVWPHESPTVVK